MPEALKTALGLLILLAVLGLAGWWIVRGVRRSHDPVAHLLKVLLTLGLWGGFLWMVLAKIGFSVGGAFVIPFVTVALGVVTSVLWAPSIGAMLAKPITSLFDGGDTEPEPRPLYSIATAKRQAGKFREAIYEIRGQLARFPNDFTGQMMLAEILAEHLNDLPAAHATVERVCQQPGHSASNLGYALNTLADWQLKYAQDIEAARAALEKLALLLPGSAQAQTAAQRIAHLGTTEQLLGAHEPRKFQLKAGVENIGLMESSAHLRPVEEDPARLAAGYVKHLAAHPADTEVRERLALIYAHHYQRLDLAAGEFNQLIDLPHQPPKQVVHWLNVLADLQVKYLRDEAAARATLQRIIDRFPGSAPAHVAMNRLGTLRTEIEGRRPQEKLHLGVYEQDIGLKKK